MTSETHMTLPGGLKTHRRRLGLSLLEVAMALVISTIATVGMMQISQDAQDQIRASGVAEQLKEVYQASQAYMQANAQALVTATAGGVVAIPVAKTTPTGTVPVGYNGSLPSLQGGGYIPGSFVNSNSYGQQLALLFRRDPLNPSNVEGLVISTGGSPIKDNNLGRIANRIGAPGGAYMLNPPPGAAAGTIMGVGGGWSTTASGWTNTAGAVTYGHAMAYLSMAQNSALTDYLYRDNIGIPEANTMHTDITMSGALPGTATAVRHNINQAGVVDVQTLTDTAGPSVGVSGELAATGPIGAGGLDPVVGMPAGWSTGVHAPSLYAESILGAGPAGGPPNSWMDLNGNGSVSSNFNVGNTLAVGNGANISNGVYIQGTGVIDWPAFGVYMTAGTGGWLEVIGGSGLYVQQTINASGSINSGSNMSASGNITANGSIGAVGDVYSGTNVTAGNNVNAASNVTAGNDVYAGNDVFAGIGMYATVYYDSKNTSYYVQPSQTSVLNNLYTTGYINAAGNINSSQNIYAAGSITGTAGLITGIVANPQWGCSPNGEIAISSMGGGLMSCQGGLWHSPSYNISSYITPTSGYYGHTNAITGGYYCPYGTSDNNVLTMWYGSLYPGYNFFHMCVPY